jgi:mono/diheme cytochrome c family protein
MPGGGALLATMLLTVSAAAAQGIAPPAGQADGQVRAGAALYAQHCALCHGERGRDATVFPRPIWGPGHDIAKFGTSRGLFEYIQLMMPFDDPRKIGDADKLAITAFMLERNGNLDPRARLPDGGGSVAIK